MKFFLNFLSWKLKKNYWMVTEMCLPFSSIQWDWMSTERSLNSTWNPDFQWTFREHSVDIQKCFSWLKGEFSSCDCQTFSEFFSPVRTYKQLSKFIRPYSTKRLSFSVFFSNVSTKSVLFLVCQQKRGMSVLFWLSSVLYLWS